MIRAGSPSKAGSAKRRVADTKPVFREAFKRRRCLVPVDNFYEWQKTGPKEKQPYAIALGDRSIMALAGLWETWRSPANETVRSFTIITTTPNELCAPIHNRMPVILASETWPAWLGEQPAEPAQLEALLAPYPANRMTLCLIRHRGFVLASNMIASVVLQHHYDRRGCK